MISIHALREEGDDQLPDSSFGVVLFLSTPSARRATIAGASAGISSAISIHALREEGDHLEKGRKRYMGAFLSTPSARRATAMAHRRSGHRRDFYPRPPRGGRRPRRRKSLTPVVFLSTPSARRATAIMLETCGCPVEFLSTPSARRATGHFRNLSPVRDHFYPRPPRGGRQQKQRQNLYFQTNYTTFCTNLEEP